MKENKKYQEKKEEEQVVHEPTSSYGMLLPHTQEELETAINRSMEDVKTGRVVSHEDVLKYYMK